MGKCQTRSESGSSATPALQDVAGLAQHPPQVLVEDSVLGLLVQTRSPDPGHRILLAHVGGIVGPENDLPGADAVDYELEVVEVVSQ